MNEALSLQYVKTTAELLKLPLEEAQAARVAVHLQRTAAMVRLLDSAGLDAHDELAEIYCPAPFPADDPALSPTFVSTGLSV
ncbi:MAG: DUF4089 domain-containing protein [Polaromonas sp.]|nr:DUF4089 domain-containing protein [Polaromonas sp.]